MKKILLLEDLGNKSIFLLSLIIITLGCAKNNNVESEIKYRISALEKVTKKYKDCSIKPILRGPQKAYLIMGLDSFYVCGFKQGHPAEIRLCEEIRGNVVSEKGVLLEKAYNYLSYLDSMDIVAMITDRYCKALIIYFKVDEVNNKNLTFAKPLQEGIEFSFIRRCYFDISDSTNVVKVDSSSEWRMFESKLYKDWEW